MVEASRTPAYLFADDSERSDLTDELLLYRSPCIRNNRLRGTNYTLRNQTYIFKDSSLVIPLHPPIKFMFEIMRRAPEVMSLDAGRNHRYPPIFLAPLDLRVEYCVTEFCLDIGAVRKSRACRRNLERLPPSMIFIDILPSRYNNYCKRNDTHSVGVIVRRTGG